MVRGVTHENESLMQRACPAYRAAVRAASPKGGVVMTRVVWAAVSFSGKRDNGTCVIELAHDEGVRFRNALSREVAHGLFLELGREFCRKASARRRPAGDIFFPGERDSTGCNRLDHGEDPGGGTGRPDPVAAGVEPEGGA